MEKTTITLTHERETKGTHHYTEESDTPVIGTLYIRKSATGSTPPQAIRVTIEPALKPRPKPKLVTFGRGGSCVCYGHTSPNTTEHHEGYDTPETFFGRAHGGPYAERNAPADYEGTPYCDVRAAVETNEGFEWAITGPMVDVDASEPQPCPEPDPIFATAVASNSFGTLLAIQKQQKDAGQEYGALDYAPLPVWLDGWKQHGATVGVIRAGRFVPEE